VVFYRFNFDMAAKRRKKHKNYPNNPDRGINAGAPGLVAELSIGVIAVSYQKIGHPTVVLFKNPLGAE
jgi:hypothetical protein